VKQFKLAMAPRTYALARRLAGTGVTANVLHPGQTATNISEDAAPPLARPFIPCWIARTRPRA